MRLTILHLPRLSKLKLTLTPHSSCLWNDRPSITEEWTRWKKLVGPPLQFEAENGRLMISLPAVADNCDLWIAGTIGNTLYFSIDYSKYREALATAEKEKNEFSVEECIRAVRQHNEGCPTYAAIPVPTATDITSGLTQVSKSIVQYQRLLGNLGSGMYGAATINYALSVSSPGLIQTITSSRFEALLEQMKTYDSEDDDDLDLQLERSSSASSSSSSASSSSAASSFTPTLTYHRKGELDGSARAETKLERRAIFKAEKDFGSTYHSGRVKARDRDRKQNRDSKYQFE